MNNTKNDGGPAFPQLVNSGVICMTADETPVFDKELKGGMSIRDWFAGQALAGMVNATLCASLHNSAQTPQEDVLATWAYAQADAMLAARGEGGK